MLPIFITLQILDFGDIIVEINTIRVIIFTITTIITIMTVNHRSESVIFVVKKIITLITI